MDELARQSPVLGEVQAGVGTYRALVQAVERAVREEDPDVRPRPDVALRPRHRVAGAAAGEERLGPRREHVHGPRPLLAEQLAAALDVADAPRVEGADALPELLAALQEELPLLGQGDLEAGQVDELLVGLDGGEVGVDGAVRRQVRGDGVAHVQSDRAERRFALLGARQRVGDDLVPARLPRHVEPDQGAGHRQPRPVVDRPRPEGALERPPPAAAEVDAPRDVVAGAVLDRGEGDGDLGRPAVVGPLRPRPPRGVPRAVAAAAVLGDAPVGLGPEPVDHEVVAGPPVVEGVEEDLHRVVVPDGVVALDHLRQRRLGVPCLEAGVEELVIVEDVDDGWQLGRGTALRLELQEVLGARRAPPFGLGDVAVDHGRPFGPAGGDAELFVAVRRLRRQRPRRGGRQQERERHREPQVPSAASHSWMIGQALPAVNRPAPCRLAVPQDRARSPARAAQATLTRQCRRREHGAVASRAERIHRVVHCRRKAAAPIADTCGDRLARLMHIMECRTNTVLASSSQRDDLDSRGSTVVE